MALYPPEGAAGKKLDTELQEMSMEKSQYINS
jgi:hypothetical protein